MKKFVIPILIVSVASLGTVRAEQSVSFTSDDPLFVSSIAANEEEPSEQQESWNQDTWDQEDSDSDYEAETLEEERETPPTIVGRASDEAARAARNRQWQNVFIAVGAVVIAVTALILVHNNSGHR